MLIIVWLAFCASCKIIVACLPVDQENHIVKLCFCYENRKQTRQIPGLIHKVLSNSRGRWDSIIIHCWRPLCNSRPCCQSRYIVSQGLQKEHKLGITGFSALYFALLNNEFLIFFSFEHVPQEDRVVHFLCVCMDLYSQLSSWSAFVCLHCNMVDFSQLVVPDFTLTFQSAGSWDNSLRSVSYWRK